MTGKCKVCGETDPMPASICLAKLTGGAQIGRPCQYSKEGNERLVAALMKQSERYAPLLEEAKVRGAAIRAEREKRDAS